MTTARVYIVRDAYGQVLSASHVMGETIVSVANMAARPIKHRVVSNSRQLVKALIQTGTSNALFDAAWSKAVKSGTIPASYRFKHGDEWSSQTIAQALEYAETVEGFISEMVNNSRSKFYIYG